jgi:hypothetical protein
MYVPLSTEKRWISPECRFGAETDIFGTITLACRDEGVIWCLQDFPALTEGWV